jgi:hypothetical protein
MPSAIAPVRSACALAATNASHRRSSTGVDEWRSAGEMCTLWAFTLILLKHFGPQRGERLRAEVRLPDHFTAAGSLRWRRGLPIAQEQAEAERVHFKEFS